MNWGRIQPDILSDEKFEDMPDRTLGFWFRWWCYALRNRTDGMVPKRAVKTKTQAGIADDLETRGLWVPQRGGGWKIHKFLRSEGGYNFSRAELDAYRERNRLSQARHRTVIDASPLTGADVSNHVVSSHNTQQQTIEDRADQLGEGIDEAFAARVAQLGGGR